jgi:hypothetical protein
VVLRLSDSGQSFRADLPQQRPCHPPHPEHSSGLTVEKVLVSDSWPLFP